MAGPGLPVNVDTFYPDSGTDPSVKAHQQHHDVIHRLLNQFDVDDLPANGEAWVFDSATGRFRPSPVAGATAVDTALAGTVVRIVRDIANSAWLFNGTPITGRPGGRTDLSLSLVGGYKTDRPTWADQPGDTHDVTLTP